MLVAILRSASEISPCHRKFKEESRLLSYADCPWSQISGSQFFFCRKNGRVFQVERNGGMSRTMFRVSEVNDNLIVEMVGRYRSYGDTSEAVAKATFEPEP